jgi:succinate-acetate transporter protein
MSIGNTFGATSLSSFGGFWIAIAIILTPGGFEIEESYDSLEFQHAFALFLFVCYFPHSSGSVEKSS